MPKRESMVSLDEVTFELDAIDASSFKEDSGMPGGLDTLMDPATYDELSQELQRVVARRMDEVQALIRDFGCSGETLKDLSSDSLSALCDMTRSALSIDAMQASLCALVRQGAEAINREFQSDLVPGLSPEALTTCPVHEAAFEPDTTYDDGRSELDDGSDDGRTFDSRCR